MAGHRRAWRATCVNWARSRYRWRREQSGFGVRDFAEFHGSAGPSGLLVSRSVIRCWLLRLGFCFRVHPRGWYEFGDSVCGPLDLPVALVDDPVVVSAEQAP